MTEGTAKTGRHYRFGAYELIPHLRELFREGEEIRVQPRVYDLLVYLVEHHDRAVDKDELQEAVWPGMYITETALTRAVMKARQAVGDDANTQRVIKTLHGHGYRFVADLLPGDDGAAKGSPGPGAEPEAAASPERPGWPAMFSARRLAWALAVALVLALGWILTRPPGLDPGETRIAVMPLLNTTGDPDLEWTRLGLMSFVSGMLDTDGQLAVVPDSDVLSIADGLGWDGNLSGESVPDLWQKLNSLYGATHVLAMHLEGQGQSLRMTYGLMTIDGGVSKGTMVGDKSTSLAQGVVQSIYGELLGRMRPLASVEAVSDDPFINEAFARGMGLSREGRCEDANPLFHIILDQEPDLFLPRFELAKCLRVLGEWKEAETLLQHCIDDQEGKGNRRYVALAQIVMGALYNGTGRLDDADGMYRQALEIARGLGDHALRGEILNQMAIVADDRSDFDRADDLINRSMLAYREAGREFVPGQLWSAKANLNMSRGNLDEADRDLARALEAYRRIGDRRREAMMINNTGFLRRLQGRLDEAEDYHLQSLVIREAIGDRVGVGRIHNFLAIIYTARAEYDKALESTQQALDIARETRDRLFEATALTRLADIEVTQSALESAERHFIEAQEIFAEIDDLMRILQVDVRLASLELERGRHDRAESLAAQAMERARTAEIMQAEVEAMELMADVAMARRDYPVAIARYGDTLDRVRETSWSSKETTIMQKLAGAFMDVSDADSAEPLIGALTLVEATPSILMTRARFEHMRGDSALAAELGRQARAAAVYSWDEEDEAMLAEYENAARGEAQ